ncbi:glycosyltransferase family 4 protein [Pleomassaria siparia CBS 279.74]|uniref:Glycosyltransferase family 4 protein n=1 Tax=Pleomassaria siparia CBS 279.74 TaxID=1314801 RepID=A0A6G1KRR8_9PLEO|nr:glycosyltransferase family 4 protein [Pleomassaria siparia CBS 279.74]
MSRPALLRKQTWEDFQAATSINQLRKNQVVPKGVVNYIAPVHKLYLGIAVVEGFHGEFKVSVAVHDGANCFDYKITAFQSKSWTKGSAESGQDRSNEIAHHLIDTMREYQDAHLYKFIAAGMAKTVLALSPDLPGKLWDELDIVPLIFDAPMWSPAGLGKDNPLALSVDEEADAMVRKCLNYFGPNHLPRVIQGACNQVLVDCDNHARIASVQDFKGTVSANTWKATMKYAESLKKNKTRIAFFNTTPQGGGVALMRHALIRYLRLIGVDGSWYVPYPNPHNFRITKNNHNILQGVAASDVRFDTEDRNALDGWVQTNVERYWVRKNCPLAPRSEGGADVIFVDDPQMPSLVKMAKELDPARPVVFRSHIQVRGDLADIDGTETKVVWDWVMANAKNADVFISHPVREFVPKNVDIKTVGYMPATTDWLDGLNKTLKNRNGEYYLDEFNNEHRTKDIPQLDYVGRRYIVQIARFDPAKGIPHVLSSYAQLRRKYMKDFGVKDIPQLVIAGHGAIDDPDATTIYNETAKLLRDVYPDVIEDVIVVRVGPSDQVLNALMSSAHVALQLSTREGFEVKVSEAVHKGIPIIATKRGGIPLQVEHGKSGYLVDVDDDDAVAKHLYDLFTDDRLYDEMSHYAATHVSDEVSTVGNALCWLYLADQLAQGKKLEPNSKWINDMAREEAGLPYDEGETRLPRNKDLDLTTAVAGDDATPSSNKRRLDQGPDTP